MAKRAYHHTMYLDEAEGFILEHALISPPRTWPPLSPEPDQQARVSGLKRKMDWEGEAAKHPDELVDMDTIVTSKGIGHANGHGDKHEDAEKERCVICLMALRDRTIVGVCGHEFCFECIGVWSNQSRRCPLCSADMAPFLLHDLDNKVPTKFYLPPLPKRRHPTFTLPGPSRIRLPEERARPEEPAEVDELDLQVERRREIYQHGLYAKHIGSNATTKFRPNPTPRQIANDPNLIQRATTFMRRELRVWSSVDVEFLTTYVLSLLKAIDIRSEPAVRLLREFLDPSGDHGPRNGLEYLNGAEHFAHELYSFLRSPYKELWKWDEVSQYDAVPSDEEAATRAPSVVDRDELELERAEEEERALERGRSRSRSRSGSMHRSRSPSRDSRDRSYSPIPRSSRSRSRSRSWSSQSYSRSPSPSRSRSRSRRRSYSPRPPQPNLNLPPRDPRKHDTYIPSPPAGGRRWDEADSWVDPEYAAQLEAKRKRRDELREAKRARANPHAAANAVPLRERIGVELLPSPPRHTLAMDEQVEEASSVAASVPAATGLTIRGAATTATARLTLLERLKKAKAEAAARGAGTTEAEQLTTSLEPALTSTIPTTPTPEPAMSKPGVRAAMQARLRLRLKLASEKKTYVFNQNESRAQALRAQILEAKARREAAEPDEVLKTLDRVDRAREIRRRLMVLRMMEAETDSERRARELKEKLMGEKKARMLREKLLERKRSALGGGPGVGPGVVLAAA